MEVTALASLIPRASPRAREATNGGCSTWGDTSQGDHTTEEAAARAYIKYLEDGIDPVKHRGVASTSEFTGVYRNKARKKWHAQCNFKGLGYHTTEEAAVRAYEKYRKDGIDPVKHREANTSQFTGVNWYNRGNKWQARCKGLHLGSYTTEEAAAQAYNVEAERVGRPLNGIPPAEAAGAGAGASPGAGGGAGPKRAAPNKSASTVASKQLKRADPKQLAAPAPCKNMQL